MSNLYQLLIQCQQALDLNIKPIIKPYNLTLPQYLLLASIAKLSQQHIAVTQIMAANEACIDAMTTSQVIKNLEKKQLLFRTVALEDSRAKALYLTNAGQKIADELTPQINQIMNDFFAPLQEEQSIFKRHLEQLL